MAVEKYYDSIYEDFDGNDRFELPWPVVRVTAGRAAEAWLIIGSEKTALYDCVMAYAGEEMVENIEEVLGDRELDYVVLSHSHYDHVAALPYVRKRWPEVVVYGSQHAKNVLERPGALKLIEKLNYAALEAYGDENSSEIIMDGLSIDKVLKDGDRLSLGEESLLVMESRGHTNCCLAFALEPQKILFATESTGLIKNREEMHVAILTSYEDAMAAAKRQEDYDPEYILSPHYGLVPKGHNKEYWQMFYRTANWEKAFIEGMYEEGLSIEEMLERCKDVYWSPERALEQTLSAFYENMKGTLKVYDPSRK